MSDEPVATARLEALPDTAAQLQRLEGLMRRLQAQPGLGAKGLGVPDWDAELCRIGREWLGGHPAHWTAPAAADNAGPDVYIATQVAEIGGHTALIGDFVRAIGRPAQLILTDLNADPASTISAATRTRLALSASQITVLPGPAAIDRLHQLWAALGHLRPARLFLFHHPHDPLAVIAAQPEVAVSCVMVHHADGTPTFGLHVPGVRVIDVSPQAAAMTRLLGESPAYLPLTSPDPGPRPYRFPTNGALRTASSGSPHKFATPYPLRYADTVAVMLRSTGGRHIHIGPLPETALSEIARTLKSAGIAADRFIHIPWAASLAETLWDQRCDVYCASFPIDGARTRVDVMAAGIPYLRHSTYVRPANAAATTGVELTWHTWEELTAALQRLTDPAVRQVHALAVRREYDATRHPSVFADTLSRILAGGDGAEDAEPERERRAARSLVQGVQRWLGESGV